MATPFVLRSVIEASRYSVFHRMMAATRKLRPDALWICRRSARAIVGEAIRETGPGVHLRQQVGDLDLGQLPINQTAHGRGGFGRFVFDRGDAQGATLNGGIREGPSFGSGRDNGYGLLNLLLPLCKIGFCIRRGGDRQWSLGTQNLEGGLGDEPIIEVAALPASFDPDIPCPKPIAQFEVDAQLVCVSVDLPGHRKDKWAPNLPNEPGWRVVGRSEDRGDTPKPEGRNYARERLKEIMEKDAGRDGQAAVHRLDGHSDPERGEETGREERKPSVNERLKDVLNKPREKLEIEEDRDQEKDQEVENEREIDRGPTHGM